MISLGRTSRRNEVKDDIFTYRNDKEQSKFYKICSEIRMDEETNTDNLEIYADLVGTVIPSYSDVGDNLMLVPRLEGLEIGVTN